MLQKMKQVFFDQKIMSDINVLKQLFGLLFKFCFYSLMLSIKLDAE